MAVTYGAQGTSGSGTTSCAPQYPTGISASTSELFAIVCGRSSVADTAIDGPAGWTSLGQLEGGTGTFGVDAGTRRVAFFRKDTVTGSETGSVTFSFAAGTGSASTLSATIFRVVKTSGFTVAAQFASGADTTNGTAFSATASSSLVFTTGGLCLVGVAQNIDSGTSSARSLTATGVTFGTFGLQVDAAVTNGSDHRRILGTATVNSAATTVAPVYAYTISAAGSGPAAFVVLDETAAGVDVALGGIEFASSAGEFGAPETHGLATVLNYGSVTWGSERALTGEGATSTAGTVTALSDGTVTLTGSGITAAQQTIVPDLSQAPEGQEAAVGRGTPLAGLRPTDITAPTIAAATGTVTAVGGGDVTVHMSGEEAAAVAGSVGAGSQLLDGITVSMGRGTPLVGFSKPLVGEAFATQAGTVTSEQFADDTYIASGLGSVSTLSSAVQLLGAGATAEYGELAVTGDDETALSGLSATFAAQSLVRSIDLALTGGGITAAQQAMGAPGGATLTGLAVSVAAGETTTSNDRTVALDGAGFAAGYGSPFASPLAFPAGLGLTLAQETIGPINVALTGEAITSGQGVLTPPAAVSTDAGSSKKKRRKHVVEIDGQIFEVASEDEALDLLAQAKEAAQELAQRTVQKSAAAKPREAVNEAREALKQPHIVASDDLTDQAKTLEREIDEIYRAAIDAIEAEARKRRAEEDEENALIQLLL
jgi:hypothetical protein